MDTVQIEGVDYQTVYKPLWYHLRGLTQTATGYGRKLNTGYTVRYLGRDRRIYVAQFSNAGTTYIIIKGKWIICN